MLRTCTILAIRRESLAIGILQPLQPALPVLAYSDLYGKSASIFFNYSQNDKDKNNILETQNYMIISQKYIGNYLLQ